LASQPGSDLETEVTGLFQVVGLPSDLQTTAVEIGSSKIAQQKGNAQKKI
jgi:hypothetical protein